MPQDLMRTSTVPGARGAGLSTSSSVRRLNSWRTAAFMVDMWKTSRLGRPPRIRAGTALPGRLAGRAGTGRRLFPAPTRFGLHPRRVDLPGDADPVDQD